MDFASIDDLIKAKGKHFVDSVFDDDEDHQAEPENLAACEEYGNAEVASWIAVNYPTFESGSAVPPTLKFAAVDFMIEYASRRRPDLISAMGGVSWEKARDAAIAKMKAFTAAERRIPEAEKPANVGATVGTNGDGASNDSATTSCRSTCAPSGRRFDDMGDF